MIDYKNELEPILHKVKSYTKINVTMKAVTADTTHGISKLSTISSK